MSEMNTAQILEHYNDGLKLASSRAREMFTLTGNRLWIEIANSLDGIRENGGRMAVSRALTRHQVIDILDKKKAAAVAKETKH